MTENEKNREGAEWQGIPLQVYGIISTGPDISWHKKFDNIR